MQIKYSSKYMGEEEDSDVVETCLVSPSMPVLKEDGLSGLLKRINIVQLVALCCNTST